MCAKKLEIEMIEIPGGVFRMGSTREEIERCMDYWSQRLLNSEYTPDRFREWLEKEFPAHPVRVEGYAIGKYPVTNGQYRRFVEETGARLPSSLIEGGPDDHPVWGVTAREAERFAAYLGDLEDRAFRLPSEAEWEYAARGPSRREYPFGDTFSSNKCNTFEAGIGTTTPVDRFPEGQSEFGIWDLAGNVEEWVADDYAPYPDGPYVADDLVDALGARYRVLRGGSFARGGDLARAARRHGPYPAPEFRYTGFRLALSL